MNTFCSWHGKIARRKNIRKKKNLESPKIRGFNGYIFWKLIDDLERGKWKRKEKIRGSVWYFDTPYTFFLSCVNGVMLVWLLFFSIMGPGRVPCPGPGPALTVSISFHITTIARWWAIIILKSNQKRTLPANALISSQNSGWFVCCKKLQIF